MPTLLIIDDDDNIGILLTRVLRGVDVTFVTTAEEALRLLDLRSFDGILCDIQLPRMSGLELYRATIQRRPELEPRFGFMTGGTLQPEADTFLAARPDLVVMKPFELDKLRKVAARLSRPISAPHVRPFSGTSIRQ